MVRRRSPRFSDDEQPKGSELTAVTSSSVKSSDVRSVLLPQPTFDHQGIELGSVTRNPLESAPPLLEAGPNEVHVISTVNPDKPSTLDIRNLDVFGTSGYEYVAVPGSRYYSFGWRYYGQETVSDLTFGRANDPAPSWKLQTGGYDEYYAVAMLCVKTEWNSGSITYGTKQSSTTGFVHAVATISQYRFPIKFTSS